MSRSTLSILKRMASGREVWAVADQALISGTNFFTNVVVARALGISEFGVFALAWMAVLFVYTIQLAMLTMPMMSFGPKIAPSDRPQYFAAMITQEVFFVGISAVLLFIGLRLYADFFSQPRLSSLSLPIAVAMATYLLQDFYRRYFYTVKQSSRAFFIDALSYVPQVPLIITVTKLWATDTSGILWLITLTSFAGVICGFFWMKPLSFNYQFFRVTLARQWPMSRWLTLSSVLGWMSPYFFMVLAPLYLGPLASGVLRASQNIVQVCNVWFLGLENVFLADAASLLRTKGTWESSKYLMRVTLRWGAFTVVVIAALGVASEHLMRMFYGSTFANYSYLVSLFGIAYILMFVGIPIRAGLLAMERPAPLFWSYLAMGIVALALGVPLIKTFGLRGVLFGVIASQFVLQGGLVLALVRNTRSRLAEERSLSFRLE